MVRSSRLHASVHAGNLKKSLQVSRDLKETHYSPAKEHFKTIYNTKERVRNAPYEKWLTF